MLTKMFKYILLQSMRFTGYTVGASIIVGSSVVVCVSGGLLIRDPPKISKNACLLALCEHTSLRDLAKRGETSKCIKRFPKNRRNNDGNYIYCR